MSIKPIISLALLLSLAQHASGQQKPSTDSSLRGPATIEVIQSYKPEVRQAPKPEFVPDLPPRDTAKPLLSYEVPQQALYYTYHSLPLRPLALGKDSSKLPFPGYVKLGGGNISTLFLDAGIGHLKGSNYEAAIHLHHLSQEGSIQNQKVSLSGLEAEGTLRSGANAWKLEIDALRNQYHYYGYDHDALSFEEDQVKQTYLGIKGALSLATEKQNTYGISYHPLVAASFYSDSHDAAERTIEIALPFSKDVDSSVQVQLGLQALLTQLKAGDDTRDNNLIELTPGLSYRAGAWSAYAGLYPTFGRGGNVYLLPDISVSYNIPNSRFFIDAGWKSSLRQNTFEQLSSYNPYLFNTYEIEQTKTDEAYAGFRTGIGNHLEVTGQAALMQYGNLPVFLNDTLDHKNFYLLYDEKVNAIAIRGSVRYQVSHNFSAGLALNLQNYFKTTLDRVWHEPGVRVKADIRFQPLPALVLTGHLNILDQIYAKNELHQEVKLDPVTDLGAGGEYLFIRRLSVFAELNNILNNEYMRWYGYKGYGLNIFGGLRLKF